MNTRSGSVVCPHHTQDLVADYLCSCDDGYTGVNCETDINECVPNPCHNGGVCTVSVCVCARVCVDEQTPIMQDMVNAYMCECGYGFTGDDCDDLVDFCESTPCQNGGSCNVSDTPACTAHRAPTPPPPLPGVLWRVHLPL